MKIAALYFVLLVLYGCTDKDKLLQGEWYGFSVTSEEPINYFYQKLKEVDTPSCEFY